MRNKHDNFLDYIPIISDEITWSVDSNHLVRIEKCNRGIYNRIAQVLFKRPKKSYIDLDQYGSFIWKNLSSTNTIYDIGELLKKEYADEIEPLYDRLTTYIRILKNNRFIILQKKDNIEE